MEDESLQKLCRGWPCLTQQGHQGLGKALGSRRECRSSTNGARYVRCVRNHLHAIQVTAGYTDLANRMSGETRRKTRGNRTQNTPVKYVANSTLSCTRDAHAQHSGNLVAVPQHTNCTLTVTNKITDRPRKFRSETSVTSRFGCSDETMRNCGQGPRGSGSLFGCSG